MSAAARELSPAGRGGVSVIEVRGADAAARVARLAPGRALEPGTLALADLRDGGELLDQALIAVPAPDRIEVHLHASPPLVARVRALLERGTGAEAAPPAGGRALPVEERALVALATAESEAAARILLDQAEGALRRELGRLCLVEPGRWRSGLALLAARARRAEAVLRPRELLLAGPVNAGKSTLFNALLGKERALVGEEQGTTRDLLVESARLGPWPVRLVDSAGARAEPVAAPEREIEAAARERAAERARGADLVLWCEPDPDAPVPQLGALRGPLLRLTTRADELPGGRARLAPRPLSARADPVGARAVVRAAFEQALGLEGEPWTPGEALPFEAGEAEALLALGPLLACDRRRAALRERLGDRAP